MEMDFCLVTINMMKILQKFANSGGGGRKRKAKEIILSCISLLHKFLLQHHKN